MKTDDLISMLATGLEPVDNAQDVRRFGITVAVGLLGAMLLMVPVLGVQAQLVDSAQQSMFWAKFAFVALLLAAGWFAVTRLSRPGASLDWVAIWIALPLVAMWVAAALVLIRAQPFDREYLILGETWLVCPFNIALLSVPAFVAVFWACKGLAPTRLRLTGAAAGLLAGATGALVYTIHCEELAPPFLGIWYVLGMLIPTGLGALLGPRLLRW